MNESNTNKRSETDWAALDRMTDADIDTSEVAPLSEEFFARAQWRTPGEPVNVAVKIDPAVLAWFKAQGADWPRRLNAALRIYVEAHRIYCAGDESAA